MTKIIVKKVLEAGYEFSLLGISLNKEQPIENMPKVAEKLAFSSAGSHRKFLRTNVLGFDLTLPRHVLTELDTYKIGTVRNSGSTMHNLHKRPINKHDFVRPVPKILIYILNIRRKQFLAGKITIGQFKDCLPEAYLQRITIKFNYEVLRIMINDRKNHRMPEWRMMLKQMVQQIDHPELLDFPKEWLNA